MSLARLVTNITSTARDITNTLQETQKTVNTVSKYTTTALELMDTYLDTNTTSTRRQLNKYTTTTNNVLNNTIDVTSTIGSYQNLDLVYTTNTYTESVDVLENHGLKPIARILQGKTGWAWEKRAQNLTRFVENRGLSDEQKDAVLHTLEQNTYLQRKHRDLYQDMTMSVLLS